MIAKRLVAKGSTRNPGPDHRRAGRDRAVIAAGSSDGVLRGFHRRHLSQLSDHNASDAAYSVTVALIGSSLCATVADAGRKGCMGHDRILRLVQPRFNRGQRAYRSTVVAGSTVPLRWLVAYAGGSCWQSYADALPTSFLPDGEQGMKFGQVVLPARSDAESTRACCADMDVTHGDEKGWWRSVHRGLSFAGAPECRHRVVRCAIGRRPGAKNTVRP